MSVQLQALADDVFEAAAAQGRAGRKSVRRPFGEFVWNPAYPDLSIVSDLFAPHWETEDLERAVRETMPEAKGFLVISRDPQTIAAMGRRLVAAGYTTATLTAMVQVFEPDFPSPSVGGRGEGFSVRPVEGEARWAAFEALIRADTAEHGWTPAMTEQLIALHRWRALNTPHYFYLAYDDDRAVGYVGLFQHGTTAYLHALFTHPAERRRGAGAVLTLAMSREARAMGCERLTLRCARDGYLPAYYGRLGFRVVGEQQVWTKPPAP